jgi:20S proteasome alpha/beta subunit
MLNHKKGTTTLAFILDKGVIVAADSRASMGGYICERPGTVPVFSSFLALAFRC